MQVVDGATSETPYTRLGGEAGVRQLTERFYELMRSLPEARTIRDMHADDLSPMIDKLSVFLTGWMGGPQRYRERFGRVIIPAVHAPYAIGEEERDAWLLCMRRALEAESADEELVAMLMPRLGDMAEMCRTRFGDSPSSRSPS
jgi:hemoglobin